MKIFKLSCNLSFGKVVIQDLKVRKKNNNPGESDRAKEVVLHNQDMGMGSGLTNQEASSTVSISNLIQNRYGEKGKL